MAEEADVSDIKVEKPILNAKIDKLKNPLFIKNITDPRTGKYVKEIYHMKMSKLDRLVEPMVWNYYRNRADKIVDEHMRNKIKKGEIKVEDIKDEDRYLCSVGEIYKKFKGKGLDKLKFIFFGDPTIYEVKITEDIID